MVTAEPASTCNRSTLMRSPTLTRYCLPPVAMTAYGAFSSPVGPDALREADRGAAGCVEPVPATASGSGVVVCSVVSGACVSFSESVITRILARWLCRGTCVTRHQDSTGTSG